MLEQLKKKTHIQIKHYIDYDKTNHIIYDNLYLEDFDVVIKSPIVRNKKASTITNYSIIISRFILANSVFLISYD